MQDFSTEFFILLEVLAGSYLVSKSLTSLWLAPDDGVSTGTND